MKDNQRLVDENNQLKAKVTELDDIVNDNQRLKDKNAQLKVKLATVEDVIRNNGRLVDENTQLKLKVAEIDAESEVKIKALMKDNEEANTQLKAKVAEMEAEVEILHKESKNVPNSSAEKNLELKRDSDRLEAGTQSTTRELEVSTEMIAAADSLKEENRRLRERVAKFDLEARRLGMELKAVREQADDGARISAEENRRLEEQVAHLNSQNEKLNAELEEALQDLSMSAEKYELSVEERTKLRAQVSNCHYCSTGEA